jgi:hypothetical protein
MIATNAIAESIAKGLLFFMIPKTIPTTEAITRATESATFTTAFNKFSISKALPSKKPIQTAAEYPVRIRLSYTNILAESDTSISQSWAYHNR